MNAAEIAYYSRRADADLIAERIKDREIRINRDYIGIVEATKHANWMADQYLRKAYREIENEFGI